MDIFTGKKSAGIGYSLCFCLFVLLSFIGQAILRSIFSEDSFAYTFGCSFFSILSFFLVTLFFSFKRKENYFLLVSFKKFNPVYIVFSLLILFGMYFGLGLVNDKVSDFFEKIGLHIINTNIKIVNVKEYLCYVFSLAILPAIFEEFFFRGFMISSMKSVSPIKGIIFVSLCFALYHGNVSQLIYQFVFSVFLCALAYYSKSVIPSIIAHFLNNFIILSILYFGWDIAYLNHSIVLIVLGLSVLVSLFVIFILRTKKQTRGIQFEGVLEGYIFASIGFILTILLIVLNLVNI